MADPESIHVPMAWIVTAGGGLATAVAALWREQLKRSKDTSKKLDDCEDKHEQTQGLVIELSSRVGRLEGKAEGKAEGVDELAQSVIDLVRKDGRN